MSPVLDINNKPCLSSDKELSVWLTLMLPCKWWQYMHRNNITALSCCAAIPEVTGSPQQFSFQLLIICMPAICHAFSYVMVAKQQVDARQS